MPSTKVASAGLQPGAGGIAWQSVQTTGFTAVASRGYPLNTTSSAFTVTFPASATAGDTIVLVDYAGTFSTNNLTVNPNGLKIQTQTGNRIFNTNRLALTFTFIDSTQGWELSSGYLEGTNPFYIPPYSVDFLVIAGGGAGGNDRGGGGGAGGYRTSTGTTGGGGSTEPSLTFNPGTVYTITVGAGATAPTSKTAAGRGADSSISGSDITTITSTGGGTGGNADTNPAGAIGGSGGAPSAVNTSISGTANQGYASGDSPQAAPNYGAGGGGGAGAVGGNGSSTTGGNGGAGVSSSITGSSVTRAGGGGGGVYGGGTGGTGGSGGGGTSTWGSAGVNGTANTGSGGSGGSGATPNLVGGSGGKGVVILSIPTASYSGTTTGSPTVTTSGANTILVYNDSGSYTG